MMKKIVTYLVNKIPLRWRNITRTEIVNGQPVERPYLHRFYLWKGQKDRALFLHHFQGSDPGPELHDHPWDISVSLILSGGYYEERFANGKNWAGGVERRWKGPLTVNFIRGSDFHRVELPKNGEAWTIFFHSKRVKPWGFLYPDGRYRVITTPRPE
jgi:hypothetical protein